jgi:4-hydroxy-2-oxoglutarate aldolase
LVTTFDQSSGGVNTAAFCRNIKAHLGAGQGGVLVAGSTGEAALLDDDERAALVAAARDVVPPGSLLLAGVGSESTRLTIKRARDAAERGADGVLVVAPHYYTTAMTRAALGYHFTAVADASPVPVLLYNIPKYVHFALEADLVEELAQHANVVGLKDSSGDAALLESYMAVQRRNPRFSVLTGHGPSFARALGMGARGGILAVALFTGDVAPRILDLWRAGDLAGAEELQVLIAPAAREVVGVHGVPGVKAAMDLAGLDGGDVRSPLLAVSEAARREIGALLPRTAPSGGRTHA